MSVQGRRLALAIQWKEHGLEHFALFAEEFRPSTRVKHGASRSSNPVTYCTMYTAAALQPYKQSRSYLLE